MILALFLGLNTSLSVQGQDIHFSQIDINPALFNPAYSGFFEGNGRMGVNYRNQWASVSEPYQTFSLTGEASIIRNKKHRLGFNLGVFAFSDHAGALRYGTTAGDVVMSVYHGIGNRGSSILSIAGAIGCGESGFDPNNASMSEIESFPNNQVFFTNLSAGIALFHQINDIIFMKVGFSGQHLNRPLISYLGNGTTYLEPKFNGYSRVNVSVSDYVSVMPMAALQLQSQFHELIYGCDVKFFLDQALSRQINLLAGVLVRHGDAIIFDLGVDYNALTIALSYDANISKLASASHTIGAIEIGVTYKLISSPEARRKAISCPTF